MMLRFCPHCAGKLDEPKILEWGGWIFDESKGILTPGAEMHFEPQHRNIIGALLRGKGDVVNRDAIYSAVCGNRPDIDWPEMKIVDVYISKIRAVLKINNIELIATAWGKGYYALPYSENPTFNHGPKHLGKSRLCGRNVGLRCKCGHIKSVHARLRNTKTGDEAFTYCVVAGCDCQRYQYGLKGVNSNAR